MAPIVIVIGLLLTLLGPTLFFLSDPEKQSATAFIPSMFGVVFLICGVLARNDNLRKHAMHAAAGVSALGFVTSFGRVVFAATQPNFQFGLGPAGSLTMAALCGILLALCVKSFIDARKARKQKESEAQTSV